MYCRNCGKQIEDNAVVCPYCGVLTHDVQPAQQQAQPVYQQAAPQKEEEFNVIALVGFILSFFICIAGLVCSIIGYNQAKESNGNGKGFAIAGIVISAVELGIALITLTIVFGALSCATCYGIY